MPVELTDQYLVHLPNFIAPSTVPSIQTPQEIFEYSPHALEAFLFADHEIFDIEKTSDNASVRAFFLKETGAITRLVCISSLDTLRKGMCKRAKNCSINCTRTDLVREPSLK